MRRESVERYLGSIRVDDVIVYVAVTALSVWGWAVFVVDVDGDVGGGPVVAAAATALGSLALVTLRFLGRRRGGTTGGAFTVPLLLLPVVTNPVFFLIITPGDAPTEGFPSWLPVAGLVGLAALLCLAGVLSGLLAFLLLVWPVLMLIDAVRPPTPHGDRPRGVSGLSRPLSRAQLAAGGVILLLSVAWSMCMINVAPDVAGSSTRERNYERLLLWVSGRGEPLPSWLALVSVLAMGASVWLADRSDRLRAP